MDKANVHRLLDAANMPMHTNHLIRTSCIVHGKVFNSHDPRGSADVSAENPGHSGGGDDTTSQITNGDRDIPGLIALRDGTRLTSLLLPIVGRTEDKGPLKDFQDMVLDLFLFSVLVSG